MGEKEAVEKYGEDGVSIGLKFFEDTAKGQHWKSRTTL